MGKGNEEKLTVKWIMVERQQIKFTEKDDPFEIEDNVMPYMDKIKNGDIVSVGFTDNKVAFVKKEKETMDVSQEEKELTIQGYSPKTKAVLFQEEENVWYPVAENVCDIFKTTSKGDKIKVKIGKVQVAKKSGGTYPKDGIVFVTKLNEENSSEDSKITNESKKSVNNSTNASIESQVALKGAIEIVKAFIEKGEITKDNVKTAIKDLTKICRKAINE
ncbi:MAG: hypothetical protein ACTSXT_08100 [Candidatus Helarchaeota archaeon]